VSNFRLKESNSLNGIDSLSDEEIALSLAEDFSEEAFNELYRRYKRKIYLWCYSYVHDMEDAVDLSQDVFRKIFEKVSTFRGKSRFSTWVYSITRNHCLGEISRRERASDEGKMDIDSVLFLEDETGSIHNRIAGELSAVIEKAKGAMGSEELEAFILHYWDGFEVNEITKILGCENVTGARALIQSARRKFKKILSEEK